MSTNTGPVRALKLGVFYDGSYFSHVSNYYNYVHPHHRRLHIGGLHDFIRHTVAQKEGLTPNLCHIIDSHFFRGRFSAKDANEKANQLYYDRVFDDVLMYNGVQTHYLPVKDLMGRKREKGIDVLMALETYELCMLKRYDVVALIASDGDHTPLVRKLHALGCKTMLLGWDFEYTDELTGEHQTTRTSSDLWNNVTYPLEMSDLVEEGLRTEDEVITDMFVSKDAGSAAHQHEQLRGHRAPHQCYHEPAQGLWLHPVPGEQPVLPARRPHRYRLQHARRGRHDGVQRGGEQQGPARGQADQAGRGGLRACSGSLQTRPPVSFPPMLRRKMIP